MLAFAMSMSACGAAMAMSSAQVVSCTESGGSGTSEVQMLKSMGDRTPPRGTPDLNRRSVDVWSLNVAYAMRPPMQSAMHLSMACGMPVCVSLSTNVCMSTVSNASLMSNATATVRAGGMGRPKPAATVLPMSCSAVPVECLALNPCRAGMSGMLCVM